ncbi:hypothetical protein B0H14DRAFT_3156604 [Mycena olivaceomarginata]|nr:hypothetical protein B0H14DRAFT_3156604 [Mycena olivaceomarginata]
MFPADSRVSAECFTQGGQHTILAYLGFTDGSVMSLTFLDIGFQDPTPHKDLTVSHWATNHTHSFRWLSRPLYLGMWHCFGIRGEIRDGAIQKGLANLERWN